jgi:hypothetical protein
MDATRATELSQDSQSQFKGLDDRYGKIGISAVAAALRASRPWRDRPGSQTLRITATTTGAVGFKAGAATGYLYLA